MNDREPVEVYYAGKCDEANVFTKFEASSDTAGSFITVECPHEGEGDEHTVELDYVSPDEFEEAVREENGMFPDAESEFKNMDGWVDPDTIEHLPRLFNPAPAPTLMPETR